jgi:hypothetical protein
MSVYVDRAKNRYGRMIMCHMLADSLAELHAMADRIGIKRKWFQPTSSPHYDICQDKRRLALTHGALEADRHMVVKLIRQNRALRAGAPNEGSAEAAFFVPDVGC